MTFHRPDPAHYHSTGSLTRLWTVNLVKILWIVLGSKVQICLMRGQRNSLANSALVSWQGSETYIKIFYEYERRQELVLVV
jgi:hypothetical protein